MKILIITLLNILFGTACETDSVRTTDIEEIVVVATPKEGGRLREQPLSSTSLVADDMRRQAVMGVKDLSALVPNLFIPSYGSRLTTSVYVRGVGSRVNTPAMALYVDGVPQVSAASYDSNFSGVDRIDVLRGPQGTLYGRNSMGGVVRVFTKNPFHYHGTDISLDASHTAQGRGLHGGGEGHYRVSATHYHRISDAFAFSANFFGERNGGYFRNQGRNQELIDYLNNAGGRMRFIFRPSETLQFDLTASHEWLKQGGYPYEYCGAVGNPTTPTPATAVGEIAYDNPSGYQRQLTNIGLVAEKKWPRVRFTSTTGFQHLNDQMDLDQDFTTTNLYTLMQRQKSSTLSEEIILTNRHAELRTKVFSYEWLLGASAFYQWARTEGPVTFHEDGLAWLNGLINQQGNAHLPVLTSYDAAGHEAYTMRFLFNNLIEGEQLGFPGIYRTPQLNTSVFHQSSFRSLFGVEGLSLSAGLRLDYEHFSLDYDASYAFGQRYGLNGSLTYPDGRVWDGMTLVPARHFSVEDRLEGSLSKDNVQLLPKLTLQWDWHQADDVSGNVYATVSRGYRSGGYNIQLFSELLQSRMQTAIMKNVADATVPVVDAVAMIPADVKQKVRTMLIEMGTPQETDVQAATWYKPESSWNYEIGTHLNLWQQRLQADVAAFWMETRDQQVSKMAEGGLGRVTVNSGRSRSVGAEVALRFSITDGLQAFASYGYTNARFRNDDEGEGRNYVPFVPQHTLAVGATQTWSLPQRRQRWLDTVVLHADYRAAGRIYWTEANSVWQNFAGMMNARLSLKHKGTELSLYALNVLSTRYRTFYFETMQRGFAQYSYPISIGVSARFRL